MRWRDLERRVDEHVKRKVARRGSSCVLDMRYGEDHGLVMDDWRQQNPQDEPTRIVARATIGEFPRPEFASLESVYGALPLVKRWLAYKYQDEADRQAEESEWRALCELAGIDYDAVLPEATDYRPSRGD